MRIPTPITRSCMISTNSCNCIKVRNPVGQQNREGDRCLRLKETWLSESSTVTFVSADITWENANSATAAVNPSMVDDQLTEEVEGIEEGETEGWWLGKSRCYPAKTQAKKDRHRYSRFEMYT